MFHKNKISKCKIAKIIGNKIDIYFKTFDISIFKMTFYETAILRF